LSSGSKCSRSPRRSASRTQQSLSSQQREHILREQLRHIQKELGEGDEKSTEIAELREAIEKAGMPQEAEDQAKKELKRLERMPDASPEFGMIRSYLDWLIGLPWSKSDPDTIDIAEARRILDEDHYGLPKIKRRILEYLAVRKLNPNGRSPILCFVGPPGVGKTSLGQSIAKATGRKFARLSLGGVHDEAEIRGHRRTYIGALPGNIIQSIRKAGTRNPVMMLDEVDKLGQGFHGDPSSALLEVLDPEQNSTFRDNYLGVAFDLSKVMFIATANVLDTIPGPVRDRMEVIELPGYTEDEKLEIAKRYLLRRQLEQTGLAADQCEITEDALRTIIRDYTREAGVRNLERLIGAVCRHVAMRIAEGSAAHLAHRWRGTPRHSRASSIRERSRHAHKCAGRRHRPRLDPHGRRYPVHRGDPGSRTRQPDPHRATRRRDEGECAGSLDSGEGAGARPRHRCGGVRKIRRAHPCAGGRHSQGRTERGRRHVCGACVAAHRAHGKQRYGDDRRNLAAGARAPIGGVKEKVLAAARAGITTVMLPARNQKDLEDIPEAARQQVRFVWLERVDDAIAAALNPPGERDAERAPAGAQTPPGRRAARSL
jgi:ATP-dependent Lon protease